MDQAEYKAMTSKLSPSKMTVFEAIRDHGPTTDDRIGELTGLPGRTVRPRRAELAKLGLVWRSPKTEQSDKRRVGVWELVPAEDVEAARESARAAGPRRRPVGELPLEVRVQAFMNLARHEDVRSVLKESRERGARRARAAIRDVIRNDERERRERKAELREAERQARPLVDFLKTRNALKQQEDLLRATLVFLREEVERQEIFGQSAIPPDLWTLIPDLLVEVIEACETAYEEIARYTGHPSRRPADIELGDEEVEEVVDGEVIELIAAEDVTRDS